MRGHRIRIEILISLFISIGAFLLLFALKVGEAQQSGDALVNALAYRAGRVIYSPHHLLFLPTIRLFNAILSVLYRGCDFLCAAQIHNILWSVASVLLFYATINYLLKSHGIALLASLLLLFSRYFWMFSSIAEPNIPSAGCLAALTAFIIFRSGNRLSILCSIIISSLAALSIFYHQSNVLFLIPLSYYLFHNIQEKPSKAWLSILALTGSIVLGGYIFIFLVTAGKWSFDGFLGFCLKYPLLPHTGWGDLKNFSALGIGRMLHAQAKTVVALPSHGKYLATLIAAFVYGIVFFWNIRQAIRGAANYKIRNFFLIWITVYFIFYLWWLSDPKFFLLFLFPFLALGLITLNEIVGTLTRQAAPRRFFTALTGIFVVALAANNAQLFIELHQSKSHEYRTAHALAIRAPERCTVIASSLTLEHLKYHFDDSDGRSTISSIALLRDYCYRGKQCSDAYDLKKEKHVIMPLSVVVPEYTVAHGNGYSHPLEWLGFIAWLFGFEYDTEGVVTGCREFKIMTDAGRNLYVSLFPARMEVRGQRDLFRILDNQINASYGEREDIFQSWFSAFHQIL